MSKTAKAKNVATGAVKGVGNGIFSGINAVWKYGGKFIIIAYAVIGAMVFGLYNPLLPDYTLGNYFYSGMGIEGFWTTPLSAGLLLLTAVIIGCLGYVIGNVRKLGKLGLFGMFAVVGLLGFWIFTMGAFEGMGVDLIAFIAEAAVVFILAFGQVFSKIDRIISGAGNVDIVSDDTDNE